MRIARKRRTTTAISRSRTCRRCASTSRGSSGCAASCPSCRRLGPSATTRPAWRLPRPRCSSTSARSPTSSTRTAREVTKTGPSSRSASQRAAGSHARGRPHRGGAEGRAQRRSPQLLALVDRGELSGAAIEGCPGARWCAPARPRDLADQSQGAAAGVRQGATETAVNAVLARSARTRSSATKSGKTQLLGFFVGQVMKEMKGKGNPAVIGEMVKKKLGLANDLARPASGPPCPPSRLGWAMTSDLLTAVEVSV